MTSYFKNINYNTFGLKPLCLENTEVEEMDLMDMLVALSEVVRLENEKIMSSLGFDADIDTHVAEMIKMVNQLDLIRDNFQLSIEILKSKTAECIAALKEKYSHLKDQYAALVNKEDLGIIPMKYIAIAFHDKYVIEMRSIVEQAFGKNSDGEVVFIKTDDILHRMQILNDYLSMGIETYPMVACFPKDDIFRHPKSSDIWADLRQVVTFKQVLTKKEIEDNFQSLYYIIRIASLVLRSQVILEDKTVSNILTTLSKDLAYYTTNGSKAVIHGRLINVQPKAHIAFQAWSFGDHPILATVSELSNPVVGYDKMIYIPRLFPQITREVILQEYADNTFNKLKPCQILQQGAPDLSEARQEALEEILCEEGDKVAVRILAPEDLGLVKSEKNYFKGLLSQASKLTSAMKGEIMMKEDVNRAIVIHIHGGGFVSGRSASHRSYLNRWVKNLNLIHFSIDYRLAPSNPYPEGLDDVWQAYLWILNYAETILGIKTEKILITGDSAGGNLAVALTLRAIRAGVKAPDGCLLLYPCLYVDADSFSPSYFTSINHPLLPTPLLKLIAKTYVPEEFKNKEDPFISPMLASDELLDKMPPIRIVVGTDDPLYDDNWRLVSKLKKLNRNVKMIVHENIPHAFLMHPNLMKYNVFMDEFCELLRELLSLKG